MQLLPVGEEVLFLVLGRWYSSWCWGGGTPPVLGIGYSSCAGEGVLLYWGGGSCWGDGNPPAAGKVVLLCCWGGSTRVTEI